MLGFGGITSGVFKVTLIIHLLSVIVGFGSTFVYAFAAPRAQAMGGPAPQIVGRVNYAASLALTQPLTWLAVLSGFALVGFSDEVYEMSQAWIVIAILVAIPAGLLASFVLRPTLKRSIDVGDALTAGTASDPGGAVAELQALGGRIRMLSGILHLAFLVLLVDMVWKPGF